MTAVPVPAGGSPNALARMLQAPCRRGQCVVIVENKSGAAGSIGAAQVASAPDGSSLLVTFDSHAVIPPFSKSRRSTSRAWCRGVSRRPGYVMIAANADLPIQSFGDVIAAAKAGSGAVKCASVGIGTLGHLADLLGTKAGVDLQHVPYRGGGPAMNDVLGSPMI